MSSINTREVVMLSQQTITTNGNGFDINTAQAFQAAILNIKVTTVSGTTPSFAFFLQSKISTAAATDLDGALASGTGIYDDLLAFTAITTNGNTIARPVTSPIIAGTSGTSGSLAVGMDYLQKDATLTAGNYRLGPIGGLLRIKWTVSGTSPSGVFSVVAQFIPYAT
jgi:hypothetical protein